MTPPRRYPALDLLRVAAISMVMMSHTAGMLQRVAALRMIRGGLWLGVDLFMLISGWLLGGQLLRDASRGRFDPRRFYVKRWLRTLPPYYAMLVILYFAGAPRVGGLDGVEYEMDLRHWGRPEGIPWWTVLTHLTFLQRYVPPNLYGVSWSLCVEEHFYLLLPAVVWLLMRKPRFAVVAGLVVAVEALAVCCRLATFTGGEWVPQATHLRCHGLFVGLMFAWLNLHRPEAWAKWGPHAVRLGIVGCLATLAVMASVPDHPVAWTYVGVPTVGTWTLALLFLPCVHEGSPWSRIGFPGLQYMGELTYSIYLVHNVIPRAWLGGHSAEAGLRGFLLRVVLVLAFSVLLHHLVERPGLALRERVLQWWDGSPARHRRAVAPYRDA
jgi:peptidoglycan/LPS O-acetylase OafA/YrhL